MSTVSFEVSPTLIEMVFRLPDSMEITGVHWDGRQVVFEVDAPDAPEGARYVSPQYRRDTQVPDPVWVTGLTWFMEDGSSQQEELTWEAP